MPLVSGVSRLSRAKPRIGPPAMTRAGSCRPHSSSRAETGVPSRAFRLAGRRTAAPATVTTRSICGSSRVTASWMASRVPTLSTTNRDSSGRPADSLPGQGLDQETFLPLRVPGVQRAHLEAETRRRLGRDPQGLGLVRLDADLHGSGAQDKGRDRRPREHLRGLLHQEPLVAGQVRLALGAVDHQQPGGPGGPQPGGRGHSVQVDHPGRLQALEQLAPGKSPPVHRPTGAPGADELTFQGDEHRRAGRAVRQPDLAQLSLTTPGMEACTSARERTDRPADRHALRDGLPDAHQAPRRLAGVLAQGHEALRRERRPCGWEALPWHSLRPGRTHASPGKGTGPAHSAKALVPDQSAAVKQATRNRAAAAARRHGARSRSSRGSSTSSTAAARPWSTSIRSTLPGGAAARVRRARTRRNAGPPACPARSRPPSPHRR